MDWVTNRYWSLYQTKIITQNKNQQQKQSNQKKKLLRKQKKWFWGKLIIKKIEKGKKKNYNLALIYIHAWCTSMAWNILYLLKPCWSAGRLSQTRFNRSIAEREKKNPPFDVIPDNSRVLTFQSIYNGTYIPQQRRGCFRIVLKVEKLTWHQFCTKGLTALMSIRCSC